MLRSVGASAAGAAVRGGAAAAATLTAGGLADAVNQFLHGVTHSDMAALEPLWHPQARLRTVSESGGELKVQSWFCMARGGTARCAAPRLCVWLGAALTV